MAKPKFDLVVVAVHYTPDGSVDWVRAYQRRGPTFSDRLKLDRTALLNEIESGRRVVIGQRVPQMAGTFEIGESINLAGSNGEKFLVTGNSTANRDSLEGVPIL